MTTETITLILLIAFGVFFGYRAAQKNEAVSPIHSGTPARVLNLLATIVLTVIPIAVLAGVFVFHLPFLHLILMVVILMLIAFDLLIAFSVIERPTAEKVRAAEQDQGWTEEDARSSGL